MNGDVVYSRDEYNLVDLILRKRSGDRDREKSREIKMFLLLGVIFISRCKYSFHS